MKRIALLIVGIVALANVAVGQEQTLAEVAKRADFVSDASFIVGTYVPPESDHSADSMALAGKAFVAALGDELRAKGALALSDQERSQWTNLPARPDAGGVRLGAMNEAQVKAACDLMAALLGRTGYDKCCQIMLGDDQLLGGRPQQGIGTVDFSVMVFGEPSTTDPWAFQLDGHHLGINVAIQGDQVSLSPSFIGAQPEVFEIAGVRFRPFDGELDHAYALIGLLDRDQREAAVLGSERANLRVGPGHDSEVPPAEGTACSSFNSEQRQAMMRLIDNWLQLLPPQHAQQRRTQIESELDQMHFSWNGEIDPRSSMSYNIQSPSLIIEFACQGRGEQSLDHLHSIYRDPTNEYGKQVD